MAKKKQKAEKSSGKGKGRLVLVLTICLPLAFFLKSTFVFILFGMMPTLVAYYVDTSKEKLLFRVVSLCNLAGVMPPAVKMILNNSGSTAFQHNVMDIKVWFIMYAAAGLGWIMVRYLPALVQYILEFNNQQRISTIEKVNQQLVQEWGPEIQRTE